MKVAFCSDTHFYHKNIIKYQNRPFEDVAEMNAALIQRWNSVCDKDTVVYFLGDFILGGVGQERLVGGIINQLNFSHLHFITGNHENGFHNWYRENKPSNITLYGPYIETTINGQRMTLSHFPVLSWNKKSHGSWMLHGHSHGNIAATSKDSKSIGKILDVGVDTNNFYPYEFEYVQEIMSEKPICGELKELTDHHI